MTGEERWKYGKVSNYEWDVERLVDDLTKEKGIVLRMVEDKIDATGEGRSIESKCFING